MTAGMAGYVINDAIIKKAAEELPLFQAIFIRGLFVIAVLVVLLKGRGELDQAFAKMRGPVLVRVGLETITTICYLLVLVQVAIAGLTAIMQIVPLLVTFVAARLLREAVRAHRVIAVFVGFVGVLFVVRPGTDNFSPWYLLAFVAVVLIVAREVATSRIDASVPSLVVALATALAITVMGGMVMIFAGWETPRVSQIALLGLGACFLSLGYIGSIVTVRIGELSFTAPFRYTGVVFAIVLQIVVFGDVPDAATFVGAALVAAAGVYAFSRERT